MSEVMEFRGILRGHRGWVTKIATNLNNDIVLSSSRDKTLILWNLTRDGYNYGLPKKRFCGHSHFISDVVLSSDGNYAITGSWDKTLRLWDLAAGRSIRRFEDHTKDVLSVAFSPDNRQIVSGSRDKTIKLWNTLADCKYTIQEDCHSDWVSSVCFSPNMNEPSIVSAGWDRLVKVWNLTNCRIKNNYYGHTGYLNAIAVSPDGSLCTSGGKDCKVMLWDLNDIKQLYTLQHNDIIEALCFSPNRYWLCVASGPSIKIWDLESKEVIDEIYSEMASNSAKNNFDPPRCLSLAWSANGQVLFGGYSDNNIRVWHVASKAK